ncbi:GNAT family N-acetyltransferase [Methanoregula formicica]|uniref:Sortase-like acyltransferase n=1 Tax=Methanoregula formicica (strain DSM 22288 / NBRC 105244 / SMSP) TaxID=593750 RepID=L0HEB9_METFS|nr:GNAT family N-acetyltransferase [Methanoregula formicica]AGB01444.1 sortase-like acyltransferase [Methanoregula formicica SMSP]
MAAELHIRVMQESDRDAVMRIFNHYARTSFAAYPEGPLPLQFFPHLKEGAISAVVIEDAGGVVGFGLLKPFFPFPAFRKTGMVTYFIAPEYTRKGLGTRLFGRLLEDAKNNGMKMLLANISSKNEGSIRFHANKGFRVAGTLAGVGEKFGKPFDVVWMQRPVE